MAVTTNSYVKVHYTGTIDDGQVFDSSKDREPLEVVLGNGMLIPGFEEGLVGMEIGEKKSVKIPSEKAYGERKEEMVQTIPKDKLPADQELKAGMQLVAQGPQGALPVMIKEMNDDGSAVLDFNHPLAGKELTFELELVEERESKPEDIEKIMGGAGHEHGEGCGCGEGDKKEGGCCKDGDKESCDCASEAEEKKE